MDKQVKISANVIIFTLMIFALFGADTEGDFYAQTSLQFNTQFTSIEDSIHDALINNCKQFINTKLGKVEYPMHLLPEDVFLGPFEGVYETNPEAIARARIDSGVEAIMLLFQPGKKTPWYAVFKIKKFTAIGKIFTLSDNISGFEVVEEDKIAEKEFEKNKDIVRAIHLTNLKREGEEFTPELRRYYKDKEGKTINKNTHLRNIEYYRTN